MSGAITPKRMGGSGGTSSPAGGTVSTPKPLPHVGQPPIGDEVQMYLQRDHAKQFAQADAGNPAAQQPVGAATPVNPPVGGMPRQGGGTRAPSANAVMGPATGGSRPLPSRFHHAPNLHGKGNTGHQAPPPMPGPMSQHARASGPPKPRDGRTAPMAKPVPVAPSAKQAKSGTPTPPRRRGEY